MADFFFMRPQMFPQFTDHRPVIRPVSAHGRNHRHLKFRIKAAKLPPVFREGLLKRAFNLSAGVSTLICTAGLALAMIAPDAIATLFTDDDGLIDVTVKALRTAMIAFMLVGYQIIATAFFQSIGNAWKSIILSLSRQVIFLIPLLLTMPGHFGLTGVWMSFPMSDICAFIVSAGMIIYELRQLRHRLTE